MQQKCGIFNKWWWPWIQHWWTHHVHACLCINHVGGHKRILLVRNPPLLVRGLCLQSDTQLPDTQLLVRDPVNVIQWLRGDDGQLTSSWGPMVFSCDRHRRHLQGLSWVLPYNIITMVDCIFRVHSFTIRNFQQHWHLFTLLGKPFWKSLIRCFLNCLFIPFLLYYIGREHGQPDRNWLGSGLHVDVETVGQRPSWFAQ